MQKCPNSCNRENGKNKRLNGSISRGNIITDIGSKMANNPEKKKQNLSLFGVGFFVSEDMVFNAFSVRNPLNTVRYSKQ
jgi:hypothetical protein